MNNEKPGTMITMLGVPNQLYCAESGRKYTADNDGVITNVDDRDRGDLNKLGAEEVKRSRQPASELGDFVRNDQSMDHNAEQHQAGDVLQK